MVCLADFCLIGFASWLVGCLLVGLVGSLVGLVVCVSVSVSVIVACLLLVCVPTSNCLRRPR